MIDSNAEITATHEPRTDINELFSDEPENPWQKRLEIQGVPVETHLLFTNPNNLREEADLDPLTKLPIEQGLFRTHVVTLLTHAIQQDIPWALISCDVDNLKAGNTKHGREFGDMVIKVGAAVLTQEIAKLGLPPDVVQIVTRQTSAADESVALLLGLSEDQLSKLHDTFVQNIERKINVQDPEFTFSQTASLLTSDSPEVQEYITSTQEYLEQNPEGVAYKEYLAIKEIADTEIKLKKIAKDIERIPTDKLASANTYTEIQNILKIELGDSRISTQVLEHVIGIITFENYLRCKDTFTSTEEYTTFIAQLGIGENMMRALTSDNPRHIFYTSLVA